MATPARRRNADQPQGNHGGRAMPAVVIPRTRPPDWPPYWRFVLSSVSEKSPRMRIIWHVLAVVNAAVWFGAGLFLTVVVGPNFFSPAVTDLVGRQNAGLIAQSVLAKYFVLQGVCTLVALALQLRSVTGGSGVGVCGRVLAAAQIGGAEPATVCHHNVRRGTPDLGAAIRDVAWGFASRQFAGAHRGFGAPGNPGSWTSGGAVLRFYQTEPVIGLVGGMRGVLAVG